MAFVFRSGVREGEKRKKGEKKKKIQSRKRERGLVCIDGTLNGLDGGVRPKKKKRKRRAPLLYISVGERGGAERTMLYLHRYRTSRARGRKGIGKKKKEGRRNAADVSLRKKRTKCGRNASSTSACLLGFRRTPMGKVEKRGGGKKGEKDKENTGKP